MVWNRNVAPLRVESDRGGSGGAYRKEICMDARLLSPRSVAYSSQISGYHGFASSKHWRRSEMKGIRIKAIWVLSPPLGRS